MLKTVLHAVVAAALWFGLRAFDVGVPWRIAAIVLGVVAVHLVWERLIFNPYLYLGVMPVADDDPVMQQAQARAKATLRLFVDQIFPEHREDSTIKFRFETSSGVIENLWADLLEVDGDKLKIYVRTPPINHDQPLDRNQSVRLDEVVDWQVEYRDGSLRGGYTNRALLTIFERQEGYLHPKLRPQLARFRDLEQAADSSPLDRA